MTADPTGAGVTSPVYRLMHTGGPDKAAILKNICQIKVGGVRAVPFHSCTKHGMLLPDPRAGDLEAPRQGHLPRALE